MHNAFPTQLVKKKQLQSSLLLLHLCFHRTVEATDRKFPCFANTAHFQEGRKDYRKKIMRKVGARRKERRAGNWTKESAAPFSDVVKNHSVSKEFSSISYLPHVAVDFCLLGKRMRLELRISKADSFLFYH